MYSSDIELKIKHLIDNYKQITANQLLQLKMMHIFVFFILLIDVALCLPQKAIKKNCNSYFHIIFLKSE